MKIYEIMVLLDPEFGRDAEAATGHVSAMVEKNGGAVIRIEKYAEQRLAYEIRRRKRGVYVLAAIRLDPAKVGELTQTFRYDEHVLRDLILDRSGLTVDKFFRHYEPSEEEATY